MIAATSFDAIEARHLDLAETILGTAGMPIVEMIGGLNAAKTTGGLTGLIGSVIENANWIDQEETRRPGDSNHAYPPNLYHRTQRISLHSLYLSIPNG